MTNVGQLTYSLPGPVGPLFAKEFPGADVSVISSGAPRVGNEEFCQAFATVIGSSMRLQYNLDAVPCVPSRIIKTPPIRYARTIGLPSCYQWVLEIAMTMAADSL